MRNWQSRCSRGAVAPAAIRSIAAVLASHSRWATTVLSHVKNTRICSSTCTLRDELTEALLLLHRPLRVSRERAAYQHRHTEQFITPTERADWHAATATHVLPDLNADKKGSDPGSDGRIKHESCGPAGLILHTIRVAFCQPLPGRQTHGD